MHVTQTAATQNASSQRAVEAAQTERFEVREIDHEHFVWDSTESNWVHMPNGAVLQCSHYAADATAHALNTRSRRARLY